MTDQKILASLKSALDADPRNGPLWLHYSDLLVQAGKLEEGIAALRSALELDDSRPTSLKLVSLLRQSRQLAEALIRAEALQKDGSDAELNIEIGRILRDRGDVAEARRSFEEARAERPEEVERELASLDEHAGGEPSDPEKRNAAEAKVVEQASEENWAEQFDWEDLSLGFDDVAGLEDVKRQINLRIIAPFKNKEVYKAFKRKGGGGILLYGPPGCGKTFIARATAGECGARFVCVSIHEIVDKYWGESEKMVHAIFEEARRRAPTVLFFDEFDALGSSRGRNESQFWKVLVNQLLQEMDGLKGRNEDLLVFAATNMPWNVDSAFRRPGRFDRVLFVPPPDVKARLQILEAGCRRLPGHEKLDLKAIASQTKLFTGADLNSLAERASERALEVSLEKGEVHPVVRGDFEAELVKMNSTASEWLSTARNYAKYSNDGGQYDELREYLKQARLW